MLRALLAPMILLAAVVASFSWLMLIVVTWARPIDGSKLQGTAPALGSALMVTGALLALLLLRAAIRRREDRA
jgi:hypothetical protein